MKKIINLILCLVIVCPIVAQTSLDSLLFNKINSYRVENNLNPLTWDTSVYKMSKHHTDYMSLYTKQNNYNIMICGHSEPKDVKGFEEINTMWNRFKRYVGTDLVKLVENVCGPGTIGKGVIFKKDVSKQEIDEAVVSYVFEGWKNSPEHNKAMLTPELTNAACSIQYGLMDNNMGSYVPLTHGATWNAYQPE